jgi:hypothetical protein
MHMVQKTHNLPHAGRWNFNITARSIAGQSSETPLRLFVKGPPKAPAINKLEEIVISLDCI